MIEEVSKFTTFYAISLIMLINVTLRMPTFNNLYIFILILKQELFLK